MNQTVNQPTGEPTAKGPIAERIEAKLAEQWALVHLEVQNESHQHSVPPNSETHFKVVLVSEEFAGLTRIKRHRAVNALLADELAGPVHALSIHSYAPAEWTARFGAARLSPPCLGGSKADQPDP